MIKNLFLVGTASVALLTTPAVAAETITVPFTTVSTSTVQQYANNVKITVSGTGFSNGTLLNDAFYNLPNGTVEGSGYYQLGFSTTPLTPFDSANAVVNLLGTRAPFNPANVYTFTLNVGSTPTNLYFGVTDGIFADNGGAYTISVAGVPEPATWSLLIVGFGAVGFAMRRHPALAAA